MKSLAWWAHNVLCDLHEGRVISVLPIDVEIEHASKQSVTLQRGDECVTVKAQ